ncbi:MAG: hypothetical protein ACRCV9_05645, partial [Burkholderiaceae bacterium]
MYWHYWQGSMVIQPGIALFYGSSPRAKRMRMNPIRFVIPDAQHLQRISDLPFECDGRVVKAQHPFIVPSGCQLVPLA